MTDFVPGTGTLSALYPTNAKAEQVKAEELAQRGKNWNFNPNAGATALYSDMVADETAAIRAAEKEAWILSHPEEHRLAEEDRSRVEAAAKVAADAEWQRKYDAANESQRQRDVINRQVAESWAARNASKYYSR